MPKSDNGNVFEKPGLVVLDGEVVMSVTIPDQIVGDIALGQEGIKERDGGLDFVGALNLLVGYGQGVPVPGWGQIRENSFLTASTRRSWNLPLVAMMPLFLMSRLPLVKSRGLPSMSVTLPPASSTIIEPAA